MLTAERRQFILEILHRNKKVLSSELSNELKVSEDTVRRDLRELAEAGLLQRVHGGALLTSPATASYADRQKQAPKEKEAIATAAAKLVLRWRNNHATSRPPFTIGLSSDGDHQ
jgi:DeoR/GlpR family transcriptional regulator of sugar metabolism